MKVMETSLRGKCANTDQKQLRIWTLHAMRPFEIIIREDVS